jgi:hypothetical protein
MPDPNYPEEYKDQPDTIDDPIPEPGDEREGQQEDYGPGDEEYVDEYGKPTSRDRRDEGGVVSMGVDHPHPIADVISRH